MSTSLEAAWPRVERCLGEPLETVENVADGGSLATVAKLTTRSGGRYALKHSTDVAQAVDGHDLRTFRAKVRQHRWLLRHGGPLSRRYPAIRGSWGGRGWSAVLMDWHDGDPLMATLVHDETTAACARVVDDLFENGYCRQSFVAGTDHAERAHIDRVLRRLDYLRTTPLGPLVDAPSLVVNGRDVVHPRSLLDDVLRHPGLRQSIRPRRLALPVHGDLNLRNLLVRPGDGAYTLLDPRGVMQPWDPLYDVGKMLFSCTLYEGVRAGLCAARLTGGELIVRLAPGWDAHRRAAERLVAVLDESCPVADAFVGEPDWRCRLLFVHACHAISEAACRVSVGCREGQEPLAAAAPLLGLGALLLAQWHTAASGGGAPDPLAAVDLLAAVRSAG
jgi:hypothetical protein